MANYYRDSGLTWKQYLQTQGFVDDITQGISRSEKTLQNAIEKTSEQIHMDFVELNSTINNGFERLEFNLSEISNGIAGLQASFNWAMGGLLHKVAIQNLLLKDIYSELRIPDFQKERRYYVEQACKHYKNGLYEESLENFLKAEPLEKTDPFVLYSIGNIYMYQALLIDTEKAQNYFSKAGKYYAAEKNNKNAAECFFHGGIAAYLNRDDENSQYLSKKASELDSELLEAFYNHAKFLASVENSSGLLSLEKILWKEPSYLYKVALDSDFKNISNSLRELLNELLVKVKAKVQEQLISFESEINDKKYIRYFKNAKVPAKDLFYKAKKLSKNEKLFDLLNSHILLQRGQKDLPKDFLLFINKQKKTASQKRLNRKIKKANTRLVKEKEKQKYTKNNDDAEKLVKEKNKQQLCKDINTPKNLKEKPVSVLNKKKNLMKEDRVLLEEGQVSNQQHVEQWKKSGKCLVCGKSIGFWGKLINSKK